MKIMKNNMKNQALKVTVPIYKVFVTVLKKYLMNTEKKYYKLKNNS